MVSVILLAIGRMTYPKRYPNTDFEVRGFEESGL